MNEQALNQNIANLQKKLKNGITLEVRNVIFQTFNHLNKYFNA